ncbi:Spliceosome-associated protein 49 [Entomophthora muscae]|uniref:Spliceosome-associated protein 49 n=1 Tax=Entomophthora muscae TaxID=34485 RepID=A0ACC2SCZ6_9FUNG|nr:Spliceosome-associated protein 49 [Entomophthora muscae]
MSRCTEALIWELMLQAGPVANVHLPKDRVTQSHQGYGFCEFQSEDDADYCIKILNMVKLFGRPIKVNKATADRKNLDVGANLFIGNLSIDVDEKLIFDTFSAFGIITQAPKVTRDPDSGGSKGFGFVSYDSFEAADAAIEAMHGQFLANKAITVSYAFKKDGKGERHGSAAERLLAAQAKRHTIPSHITRATIDARPRPPANQPAPGVMPPPMMVPPPMPNGFMPGPPGFIPPGFMPPGGMYFQPPPPPPGYY